MTKGAAPRGPHCMRLRHIYLVAPHEDDVQNGYVVAKEAQAFRENKTCSRRPHRYRRGEHSEFTTYRCPMACGQTCAYGHRLHDYAAMNSCTHGRGAGIELGRYDMHTETLSATRNELLHRVSRTEERRRGKYHHIYSHVPVYYASVQSERCSVELIKISSIPSLRASSGTTQAGACPT